MSLDDTADKLENTVKEIRTFLLEELDCVERIQYHLKKNDIYDTLKDDVENDVDDNIDYLVRDLVPKYPDQLGGIDTLVNKLKEVQKFRNQHLGQINWEVEA
jgi:23S rRNA maturation-related 3'-5' exoribonuclease YhaM